jgi:hypothetical protein
MQNQMTPTAQLGGINPKLYETIDLVFWRINTICPMTNPVCDNARDISDTNFPKFPIAFFPSPEYQFPCFSATSISMFMQMREITMLRVSIKVENSHPPL